MREDEGREFTPIQENIWNRGAPIPYPDLPILRLTRPTFLGRKTRIG